MRLNTPALCVVTKGIKPDCNRLMRTTTPMLASGLLIADVVNKKAFTLSEEETLQKMRESSLGAVWENVKNDSW